MVRGGGDFYFHSMLFHGVGYKGQPSEVFRPVPAGMIVHDHAMRRMDRKAYLGPGAGRTASSGGSGGFSKCEVPVELHI